MVTVTIPMVITLLVVAMVILVVVVMVMLVVALLGIRSPVALSSSADDGAIQTTRESGYLNFVVVCSECLLSTGCSSLVLLS